MLSNIKYCWKNNFYTRCNIMIHLRMKLQIPSSFSSSHVTFTSIYIWMLRWFIHSFLFLCLALLLSSSIFIFQLFFLVFIHSSFFSSLFSISFLFFLYSFVSLFIILVLVAAFVSLFFTPLFFLPPFSPLRIILYSFPLPFAEHFW